jgi:hypothetical protein
MKIKMLILLIGSLLLTGCNISYSSPPTPTPIGTTAFIFVPTLTPSLPTAIPLPAFTPTATPIAPVAANVCTDPQVVALIDSLKRAMLNNDGALLSSVVSPNGMTVHYYHVHEKPITYSAYQAQFLFETTYQADWGSAPASGLEKKGSFHEVVVPDLKKIFSTPYTLQCNEIRHGGANYNISWPYNKDFYSIYDAGTQQNGNMDWHTWVAGIEYVNGKPYIYALMQFFWEP